MEKNEVYSWRVSAETKSRLEDEARRVNASVGELLEQIVNEWLAKLPAKDASRQRALHAAASKFVGAIHGGDSRRAERASALVRESLAKRRRAR
jgi:hypothetical protein